MHRISQTASIYDSMQISHSLQILCKNLNRPVNLLCFLPIINRMRDPVNELCHDGNVV